MVTLTKLEFHPERTRTSLNHFAVWEPGRSYMLARKHSQLYQKYSQWPSGKKNANPSSGVVRGATNQPWWWGSGENTIPSSGKVGAIQIHLLEKGSTKNPLQWQSGGKREDTIPFSGRVGGDTNPSYGEGKHKSPIVVEWGSEKTQFHLVAGWVGIQIHLMGKGSTNPLQWQSGRAKRQFH